jgi:hypothetical protein
VTLRTPTISPLRYVTGAASSASKTGAPRLESLDAIHILIYSRRFINAEELRCELGSWTYFELAAPSTSTYRYDVFSGLALLFGLALGTSVHRIVLVSLLQVCMKVPELRSHQCDHSCYCFTRIVLHTITFSPDRSLLFLLCSLAQKMFDHPPPFEYSSRPGAGKQPSMPLYYASAPACAASPLLAATWASRPRLTERDAVATRLFGLV